MGGISDTVVVVAVADGGGGETAVGLEVEDSKNFLFFGFDRSFSDWGIAEEEEEEGAATIAADDDGGGGGGGDCFGERTVVFPPSELLRIRLLTVGVAELGLVFTFLPSLLW